MAEQTENEYIKDKEVVISNIELEMYDDKENIKRIRFVADVGDITFKPFVTKEEFQNGFKVLNKLSMALAEIPEKMSAMAKVIAEKKTVKVKVSYSIFEKDYDGETRKYRYINSLKTFKEWEIL